MSCGWPSTIATSSLLLRATTPRFWFHSFPACSFFSITNPVRGFRCGERQMVAGKPRGSPIPPAELLAILDAEPERLSPNALLRPVFQDSILPTAAYVGGPSEVAYFAQSQVLYERILGRTTPVLPRLSATLIEPAIAGLLARHDVSLPDVIQSALKDPLELAQRLGARAISVVGKRKLAAAGNALDTELSALATYMHSLDPGLGRAADVSSSKMRYQMNRMRRLAANYELRREQSLGRDAGLIALNLFPDRHPQERILGAAWFLSRYGEGLAGVAGGASRPAMPRSQSHLAVTEQIESR